MQLIEMGKESRIGEALEEEDTAFLVTRELAGVLSVAVVMVQYRTGSEDEMRET